MTSSFLYAVTTPAYGLKIYYDVKLDFTKNDVIGPMLNTLFRQAYFAEVVSLSKSVSSHCTGPSHWERF